MTDTTTVRRNIAISFGDEWLAEVRGYMALMQRPDAARALASQLQHRTGIEHDPADTISYLTNTLVAALRYASGMIEHAYGGAIPAATNAREPERTIRTHRTREVVRDKDGRIDALQEVETTIDPGGPREIR